MRRRVVDIAASGAVCGAVTAALMLASGPSGQRETASHTSVTEVTTGSAAAAENAPPSPSTGGEKRCALRSWRPAVVGRGAAARVVGYGSIICDKPGRITFDVALCRYRPDGRWACATSEEANVRGKWGAYVQLKVTLPCEQTPGWETYRTDVTGEVLQGWDRHQESGEKARLFCPR